MARTSAGLPDTGVNFQPMETPLVMSGFQPEAIRLWQEKMAGTGLDEVVAAGGGGGSLGAGSASPPRFLQRGGVVPGSAVSAQLVRGDLEIAATCTVTYVDPKQLLACGHPDPAGRAGLAAHDDGRRGGDAGLAAATPSRSINTGRDHWRIHRGSRRGHSRRAGRAAHA